MNKKSYILLILLFCTFSFNLKAEVMNGKTKEELVHQLNHTDLNDTTRLQLCYQLKKLAINSQLELYYTNRLMKDAERLNHSKYKCLAYLGRMILAYNDYDVEEVNKWMQKLEPIAESNKFYDLLFSGKRCVIDMMMVKGEFEREEKEAKRMLHKAKALDNKIGIILAYQCLSNVYGMTYRNNEAVEMKELAYKVASIYDIDLAMEIISSFVRTYEDLKDWKNQLKWMKIMDANMQNAIKKDPSSEERFSLWKIMNQISYLNYYTSNDNLRMAETYLKLLEKNIDVDYNTYLVKYHLARCNYFYKMKMLDEALKEADELIRIYDKDLSKSYYSGVIYLKADILAMMRKEDLAIDMYKKNLLLTDSVNLVMLNKQAQQIRSDYKTDTLLLEKENTRWYIQCLMLSLVLIFIVILVFFAVHKKKTQNELKRSECDMRKMADQMKQANEAKEKFLSTISTSINVPLNVVVTESLRLASDEVTDRKDRSEISQRINETSAELMKLINNILNLSKLEAGMMKFNEEDLDIVSCLQSIVSIKRFEGCPVNLVLPADLEKCLVHADPERLREVFNILLISSSSNSDLHLELKVESKTKLCFYITGSKLTVQPQHQTRDEMIETEVVRLLIEHFRGTFEIRLLGNPDMIYFTLPIVKRN